MNVTPTPKMLFAMEQLTEKMCGPAPTAVEKSTAANDRRAMRRACMDVLHELVRLSMREGVRRYCDAMGLPTTEDQVIPDPVAKELRTGLPTSDVLSVKH